MTGKKPLSMKHFNLDCPEEFLTLVRLQRIHKKNQESWNQELEAMVQEAMVQEAMVQEAIHTKEKDFAHENY
jgi:hypothetical protein